MLTSISVYFLLIFCDDLLAGLDLEAPPIVEFLFFCPVRWKTVERWSQMEPDGGLTEPEGPVRAAFARSATLWLE